MSSTPEVQTIIVRARVKPLSEQPEWAMCCDRIKSQFEDVGELYVNTAVFVAELKCPYCGAVNTARCMKIAKIIHPTRFTASGLPERATAIAVDCYELDEGATPLGA